MHSTLWGQSMTTLTPPPSPSRLCGELAGSSWFEDAAARSAAASFKPPPSPSPLPTLCPWVSTVMAAKATKKKVVVASKRTKGTPSARPGAKRSRAASRGGGGGSAGGGACSIDQCLEAFTEPEVLSGSDAYYCSKCKEHCACEKRIRLYRCPPVLVLHLKRFNYTMYRRDKLCTDVKFPVRGLDLSPYCAEGAKMARPPTYDLIGVSNHMGGLGGGHYVATCLNDDTQKWHNFNDSRVSSVSEASLSGSAAYILFYQRR